MGLALEIRNEIKKYIKVSTTLLEPFVLWLGRNKYCSIVKLWR
jgi:hypothetical protein